MHQFHKDPKIPETYPNDRKWRAVCSELIGAFLRSLQPFILLLRVTGIQGASPAIAGQCPVPLVRSKRFRR